MFNPGETVAHQFIVPFVADEIAKAVVTYKQDGDIVFEKTITSGFENVPETPKSKFTVTLSQEDSLLFEQNKALYIQINILTKNGKRAASKPIKSANGYQFHGEVITGG